MGLKTASLQLTRESGSVIVVLLHRVFHVGDE